MPEATEVATRPSRAGVETKIVQLIVFRLGDEEFGVEIGEVREIIRTGTVTPIPDSPGFIKGVINVRGEIVATIDLKTRFLLPTDKGAESRHTIITEQEKNVFGLMVDEVTEVLRIPETEVKAAPELVTKIHQEYVSGVVTMSNRLIILIELAKVLSEEELTRLTETERSQRAITERKAKAAAAQAAKAEQTPPQGSHAAPPEAKKTGKRGKSFSRLVKEGVA